jgi:hypothetical protein
MFYSSGMLRAACCLPDQLSARQCRRRWRARDLERYALPAKAMEGFGMSSLIATIQRTTIRVQPDFAGPFPVHDRVDACGDFRAEAVGGERGELDEVECEVWEEGSECIEGGGVVGRGGVMGGTWWVGGGTPVVSRCSTTGYRPAPLPGCDFILCGFRWCRSCRAQPPAPMKDVKQQVRLPIREGREGALRAVFSGFRGGR